MSLLSREQVLELLHDLARRMEGTDTVGIRIVGGAAIALQFEAREATRDIDAALILAPRVKEAVAEIAVERGLPSEWLNDAAVAYFPLGNDDWIELFREGDVRVSIADPRMLLAMKLRRSRGRRDHMDIELLLDAIKPNRPEDVEEIYDRYFPQDLMPDEGVARIDYWFERRATQD